MSKGGKSIFFYQIIPSRLNPDEIVDCKLITVLRTETMSPQCLSVSLFLHTTTRVPGGGIHDLRDAEGRVVSYQTFLRFINKLTQALMLHQLLTNLYYVSVSQQICSIKSGKHSGEYSSRVSNLQIALLIKPSFIYLLSV